MKICGFPDKRLPGYPVQVWRGGFGSRGIGFGPGRDMLALWSVVGRMASAITHQCLFQGGESS